MLFTNRKVGEVVEFFDKFEVQEYAHSGQIAPMTIIIEVGTNIFERCGHSIEPYLRKLGVDTKLDKGMIVLNTDYTACVMG